MIWNKKDLIKHRKSESSIQSEDVKLREVNIFKFYKLKIYQKPKFRLVKETSF